MSDPLQVEYTEWFVAELDQLPADQQVRVVKRTALLERKGWNVSAKDRDIVHLKDGIWEIRVLGTGPAYRLLCFVAPGAPSRIVVLTNCVKKAFMKKEKVKDAEIERARSRREVWLRQQGER